MADKSRTAAHGHPLPASEEARRDLVPEHLVDEKGLGEDPAGRVQPAGNPVTPEGEPYPAPDGEGNC